MSAFIVEWFNLLVRWAHLVVGIGWIGTSFYFIALDLSLRKREGMREGVYGTAWEVHGGGFYQVEKYLVAPKELPPDLVWYKWEAYLTWVTGFLLLVLQYYWNADAFLISRDVLPMLPSQAIFISVASLAAGWFIYDRLCKSRIGTDTLALAIAVFILVVAAAWFYAHVFSGRGALIHVGAFIGTIMAVNVFGIIIPNQRKIVASLIAHERPDPRLGAIGKQRSVHNNYLTLPVLLTMISNHYPMTYGHPRAWLVLAALLLLAAYVRHFFNLRHRGRTVLAIPVTAAIGTLALAVAIAPERRSGGSEVSIRDVQAIVEARCVACHAEKPRQEGIAVAPKGVVLETPAQIAQHAAAIRQQAVASRAMPLGNLTNMTDDERARLGAWIDAGARVEP